MPIRIAEEGREYELEVGREVPAYRLIMGGETGGGTEMWVARFGRVFRESALGFSSRRGDSPLSAMYGLEPLFPPAALQRLINIESLTRIIDQVKGTREAEAEEAAEALRNQINERNLHD